MIITTTQTILRTYSEQFEAPKPGLCVGGAVLEKPPNQYERLQEQCSNRMLENGLNGLGLRKKGEE